MLAADGDTLRSHRDFMNRFANAFTYANVADMSTIAKVAERAGVSRTTVSHVINHADRVSPAMRERVEQAIRELGYAPNPQAQSLRTGRTNVVAMLIPDIRNPLFPEMVGTAQAELGAVGLDMLIFNTDVPGGHAEEYGREFLRQIGNKRVDGLIVAEFALHGMLDALRDIETPTVFIGQLPERTVDCVKNDDYGGGYQMGAYLARRGHRRVAQITGPTFFAAAMARAAGFEQGLADNGVQVDPALRYEGSFLAPSGMAAARWLIETHGDDPPSAVFFGNFLMASGALAEFYDRGVKVPDDIKIAIFGDQAQFDYVRPRLTRVGNAPSELARRATAMLLDRLNGTYTAEPRSDVVPCTLRELDTA
jgi:DNA-binding LacI/PurR family transcriptional regulator